jgi:hypothetical protein
MVSPKRGQWGSAANVVVEYYWLDGHYDRLPGVIADLVRPPLLAETSHVGGGAAATETRAIEPFLSGA